MAEMTTPQPISADKFAALAAHADSFRALDPAVWDGERADALAEHESEVRAQLFQTPAPDQAALLWKLERLLEVDESGSINCWSGDYVAQTVADIRRFLA